MASNYEEHDVRGAEFVRTYKSDDFPGYQLLKRLEVEQGRRDGIELKRCLPDTRDLTSDHDNVHLRFFAEVYGFRGSTNKEVIYLSPWEFKMWWSVRKLPQPPGPKPNPANREEYIARVQDLNETLRAKGAMTIWSDEPRQEESGEKARWEPNPDYSSKDVCFYPEDIPGSTDFRRTWYMHRNRRLMIPSPTGTVMPDKVKDEEKKAKLYSLYLRPWVLREKDQIKFVPHIVNLPSIRRVLGREDRRVPEKQHDWSWQEAWSTYIRGHVVSEHSRRLIVQFMAACCGKSTTHDEDEGEAETKVQNYEQPTNDMAVGRVHEILKCMSAEEVKNAQKKKLAPSATNAAAATEADAELEEGATGRTGL